MIFGDVNPSGKLTMSFPKNVGQVPLYYAAKNTGRPLLEGRWFEKFRSNYLYGLQSHYNLIMLVGIVKSLLLLLLGLEYVQ